MARARSRVVEDFDGPALDPDRWCAHYLPAWSSRAATAATYEVRGSCLELWLPPGGGAWLPGEHEPPLRVSGIQSGNRSGPVGSSDAQQTWGPGAVVREEQPDFRGWLAEPPCRLSMRARMELSPRSMAAWWLVGFEDVPQRSAEICVAEVFGDAVVPGVSAAVGAGLHPFRDPAVNEDFDAPRVAVDVADFHEYAVTWTAERVEFSVDGTVLRSCEAPPVYPMQSMLAVFDFPDRSRGDDDQLVPRLVVERMAQEPFD